MKEIIFLTDFKQNSFDINDKSKARDFFYGIDLLEKNYKVKIFDIGKLRVSKNKFIILLSKLSFVITGVYGTINQKIYHFFKNIPPQSKIICANDGIGFCCLIMNFILNKKFEIYLLSMGFYSKYFFYHKNLSLFYIRKFLINFLLKKSFKILFLGEQEYIFFTKLFKNHKSKASLFRFRIDDVFWKVNFLKKNVLKPYILFIGNDLMRNYEIIYKIAKKCPNLEFKIISERFKNLYPKKIKNITNFGFNSNHYYQISDKELRKIIQEAKCLLLPIKNTLQPSGQSVCLQSMACKTPVITNYYEGLWEKENMINFHNCLLLKENANTSEWIKNINLIFEKEKELQHLTDNAYEEFIKNYSYKGYLSQWIKIINDVKLVK